MYGQQIPRFGRFKPEWPAGRALQRKKERKEDAPEGRVALVNVGKGDVTGRASKVLEVLRVLRGTEELFFFFFFLRKKRGLEERGSRRVAMMATTATTISKRVPRRTTTFPTALISLFCITIRARAEEAEASRRRK